MKKILFLLLLMLIPSAFSALQLNDIQFDPAIIASGDEVDIIVQYQDTALENDDSRISNTEYSYRVRVLPEDTLTEEFVTIVDADGDKLFGTVYAGATFNRVFRVKVSQDAPAATYRFKLEGQWYKNGVAQNTIESVDFSMVVKREGVSLDIGAITTQPLQVRPGDNFVTVQASIANTGEKDAQSIELLLQTPDGITPSYSDVNRKYLASLAAGESETVTFSVNIDEDVSVDTTEFMVKTFYEDDDNNEYTKTLSFPFLLKSKPDLVIEKVEGEGLAGSQSTLTIYVKNIGADSAEAVDVRLIKQHTQPFVMDIRNQFIGELEPNQTGVVVFDIKVNSDAEIKEHNFQLQIRAKGDTDEGDDTIYTYSRSASFDVTGKQPSYWLYISAAVGVVLLLVLLIKVLKK